MIFSAWAEPGAPASNADPKFQALARNLLHQYSDACALLHTTYGDGSTDPDVLRLRGTCEEGQGHNAIAVEYFRRAVALLPNDRGARLDLAKALAAAGETSAAENEYQSLLKSSSATTPEVSDLQAAIRGVDRLKPWYARIEGGFVYDTNINAGPNSNQVFITGIPVPFTLAQQNQKTDSAGYYFSGAAGYNYQLNDDFSILGQIGAGNTAYFDTGHYDLLTVNAAVGPVYRHDLWTASLLPFVEWTSLGGKSYRTNSGGNALVEYALDADWTLRFNTAVYDQNYAGDKNPADGWAWSGAPGFFYRLTDNIVGVGQYAIRVETTYDKQFQDIAHGPGVGLRTTPYEGFSLNGDYQFLHADYDAGQPFFGNLKRSDNENILSVNGIWDIGPEIKVSGLEVAIRYQYLINDSNTSIYDYDRHQVTFGIAKRF